MRFLILSLMVLCALSAPQKVRHTDVTVLTLHKGRMSEGRRSAPVPQLTCLSGCDFTPETVQCYNRGSDGHDVQWECKADLPGSTRFGEVTVACEGYDYPDDPFILQGSCGLEYSLLSDDRSHGSSHSSYNSYDSKPYSRYGWGSSIFVVGLMCFVAYYVYNNCLSPRGAGGFGGGAGGSRWGGDFPGGGGPYGGGSYGGGNNDGYKGSQSYGASGGTPTPSTGPGFWSGMLGGGALGYMLGNRNNGYGGYQQPWGGFGGGFTNRGFGGGGMRMGGGGGGMRSSSGFGGTRRR